MRSGRSSSRNPGAIRPIEPRCRRRDGIASKNRRTASVQSPQVPGESHSEDGSVSSERAKVIPRLGIVVPCFNEEEVLPETARRLTALLQEMLAAGQVIAGSQIVFVDDGSLDRTWAMIEAMASTDARVGG